MKARVTIEYIFPNGGLTALRDQEGQHWSSERLLQLRSAVVKNELIDEPALP